MYRNVSKRKISICSIFIIKLFILLWDLIYVDATNGHHAKVGNFLGRKTPIRHLTVKKLCQPVSVTGSIFFWFISERMSKIHK